MAACAASASSEPNYQPKVGNLWAFSRTCHGRRLCRGVRRGCRAMVGCRGAGAAPDAGSGAEVYAVLSHEALIQHQASCPVISAQSALMAGCLPLQHTLKHSPLSHSPLHPPLPFGSESPTVRGAPTPGPHLQRAQVAGGERNPARRGPGAQTSAPAGRLPQL